MKKLYIVFLGLSLTVLSTAQHVEGTVEMPLLRSKGDEHKAETLDQATVKVYYLFSQKRKGEDEKAFRNDTMTLHVGPQMSFYFDETKVKKDSLASLFMNNLNPNTLRSVNVLKNTGEDIVIPGQRSDVNYLDGTTEKLYKNRRSGEMTLINDYSSALYRCSDPIGPFNWTITSDTATIFGYSCQKAETAFRGRDYEVWFAPEIPLNDGPWKFFGLPGLIMRVCNRENKIAFDCIGLQYLDNPYRIEIPSGKYIRCNRKEYEKIMNKKGAGISYILNGGNLTVIGMPLDPSHEPLEVK